MGQDSQQTPRVRAPHCAALGEAQCLSLPPSTWWARNGRALAQLPCSATDLMAYWLDSKTTAHGQQGWLRLFTLPPFTWGEGRCPRRVTDPCQP